MKFFLTQDLAQRVNGNVPKWKKEKEKYWKYFYFYVDRAIRPGIRWHNVWGNLDTEVIKSKVAFMLKIDLSINYSAEDSKGFLE